MSKRPPAPRTPDPSNQLAVSRLSQLVNQTRLINGIFAALSSSLEIDDLHLILLTILTTPRGLGFTRGHLFVPDPESNGRQFRGHLALGCRSAEELLALEHEISTEESMLASMAAIRVLPGGEEGRNVSEDLNDLRSQTWWITAYQMAHPDNPLTELIRGRPLFKSNLRAMPRVIDEVSDLRATHMRLTDLPRYLDPETAALLGDEFLLAPLRTKAGVHGVVAVDKAFQSEGPTDDDQANLEWLCNQAGLALQNADLFADLQRAYNEIQAVDTLKSNFLSTISHELRTPLTSILGFVQLILEGRADGGVNETQRRLLERVVDKSRDLHNMVNDILEIAEIQAEGLVRLDPEPVGLEEIIEQVIDRVAQRRRTAEVEIRHHRPAQPLPLVMGDVQAVERVFYHIIDNAVKFIPLKGTVTVSYRSMPGHVEVSVCDTGIGIASEHLERIFDHFYQIENDLSRSYNGVGLGLTITKKLLMLLNAAIHVESEPGRGTAISVTFEVAEPEETP